MRKWLRSWFAWRFSLRRLVVAVVFFGAFAGLNLSGPEIHIVAVEQAYKGTYVDVREYRAERESNFRRFVVTTFGWPFPVVRESHEWNADSDDLGKPITREQFAERGLSACLPWTHQTYVLCESDWLSWPYYWGAVDTNSPKWSRVFTLFIIIDALFALTSSP